MGNRFDYSLAKRAELEAFVGSMPAITPTWIPMFGIARQLVGLESAAETGTTRTLAVKARRAIDEMEEDLDELDARRMVSRPLAPVTQRTAGQSIRDPPHLLIPRGMCRRVDEWTGGRGTSTLTSPPRRNPHSRRRRVVTHLVTGANGSASRHPVAGRDEGTMQARRVQQGCRRVRWVAAAGAIALAGCGAGGQDAPIKVGASSALDEVTLVGSDTGLISGGQQTALRSPGRALFGETSPLAVPGPGNSIYYNAWTLNRTDADQTFADGDVIGRPSIRKFDRDSGTDELVADGSHTVAVRSDGTIAYVRGTDDVVRAAQPFTGSVIVSGEHGEEVWVKGPGQYLVSAWAGPSVIFQEILEGEGSDLLIANGPGEARTLATGSGLVALNPSGTHAVIAGFSDLDGTVVAELVEVATGEVLATLPAQEHRLTRLGVGFWDGDRIVAGGQVEGAAALIMLSVEVERGPGLRVERAWTMPDDVATLSEARIVNEAVVGLATPPSRSDRGTPIHAPYELVTCAIDGSSCTNETLDVSTDQQVGVVHNPSRPTAPTTQAEPDVDVDAAWERYKATQAGQVRLASAGGGDRNELRALARDDAGNRVITIAELRDAQWRTVADVALPAPDYPFSEGATIALGDASADGRVDFLVPLVAAQPVGVVISDHTGRWDALPIRGADGKIAEPYVGLNPRFERGALVSDERLCEPNCAEGGTRTVTWRFVDGALTHSQSG